MSIVGATTPTRESQVGEEREKIGRQMAQLSEEISNLEQRLQSCLKQSGEKEACEKKNPQQKVELANWLYTHGEDLDKQIYRIKSIFDRCEL